MAHITVKQLRGLIESIVNEVREWDPDAILSRFEDAMDAEGIDYDIEHGFMNIARGSIPGRHGGVTRKYYVFPEGAKINDLKQAFERLPEFRGLKGSRDSLRNSNVLVVIDRLDPVFAAVPGGTIGGVAITLLGHDPQLR